VLCCAVLVLVAVGVLRCRRAALSACCAVGVLRCRRAGGAVAAAALCEAAGPGAADEHTGTPGKCVCARARMWWCPFMFPQRDPMPWRSVCGAPVPRRPLPRLCATPPAHSVSSRAGCAPVRRNNPNNVFATMQTCRRVPTPQSTKDYYRVLEIQRDVRCPSVARQAAWVLHGWGTTPVVGSLLATHAAFVLRCVALRCVPLLKN